MPQKMMRHALVVTIGNGFYANAMANSELTYSILAPVPNVTPGVGSRSMAHGILYHVFNAHLCDTHKSRRRMQV